MVAFLLASAVASAAVGRALPTPPFRKVDLATGATLKLEQSPSSSVVVSGDPRLVPCISAEVRDGRLSLAWAGAGGARAGTRADADAIVVTARRYCRRKGDAKSIGIRVAAPLIDEVTIVDEGVVRLGAMRTPSFAAKISGRGSIAIDDLRADTTAFSIPGIGRIVAGGELGRLRIDIPGQGIVDARSAHARAIDLVIGGHGEVAASVDGPASGSIAGSGRIAITDHPRCAIRSQGVGQIVCPAD